MPARPDAMTAASARYGLADASHAFSSMFAASAPSSSPARHVAQGRLAVLDAPERVRAGEVARPQPDLRRHARRRHGRDRRQLPQQPRDPARALARGGPAGEQVAPVARHGRVQVPALPDARRRDERREAGAQAVGPRGRVDRLAGEHLVVGRVHRVGGGEAQLDLRQAVLGVELTDRQAVGVDVAQQVGDELVDLQQRVRAVGGTAVRGDRLVLVEPDEELDLEPRGHLETGLGGGRELPLQRAARIERPRRAVGVDDARGSPRERRLAGERDGAVEDGDVAHVARRGRQALVRVRDRVVGVEDRQQRGRAHAAAGRRLDRLDGHGPRSGDAVVVGPDDREAGDARLGQLARETCGIGHAASLTRCLDFDDHGDPLRRPRAGTRRDPGLGQRRGPHPRVRELRGDRPHPRDRRAASLEPQPRRALAQGRDVRQRAEGPRAAHGLRRRRRARPRRAGRSRVPHGRADVLPQRRGRRPRAARGAARPRAHVGRPPARASRGLLHRPAARRPAVHRREGHGGGGGGRRAPHARRPTTASTRRPPTSSTT